ncbi:hypothetical protein B566_EDAN012050 [Ephemera danica]|nr:hypothetical protein B566_EDAN012050 [Ephemera danica]
MESSSSRDSSLNSISITDVEVVALDCEMVGAGCHGRVDLLARVSVVNKRGEVLYDSYVKPRNNVKIIDYRTTFSGVRPEHLEDGAVDFVEAQQTVIELIKDRLVVGHDMVHDFRPFQRFSQSRQARFNARPRLKVLADKLLNLKIQQGEHDSVVDAKTAMALYMRHREAWEESLTITTPKPDPSTVEGQMAIIRDMFILRPTTRQPLVAVCKCEECKAALV